MAYQWISQLPDTSDGLFEKLSSPNEGWCISVNEKDIDVPIGKLDETAYQILSRCIEFNQKTAIAIPRVRPGVSLSIIAYLVVNRFIGQHGRSFENFHPIELTNGRSIVIATQDRKLRDFFLLSSLKFSGSKFPFTQFPISRINLSGELVPLVGRNESKGQIAMNPIIFYHFDELAASPTVVENGCLLGELTETNSSHLAERLCQFINNAKIESSLLLVNKYSENTLSILRANGFKIITLGNEDILRFKEENGIPNLPSLNSSLCTFPNEVALKVHLVEDKAIESSLTKILQILLAINNRLGKEKPRVFSKVWGLFYTLKDLCVPLPSLETYRKGNAWLKTIKHNIEQKFKFPINTLPEEERNVLFSIWGTLETEFADLYRNLERKNPKYEYLKTLLSTKTSNELCVVFPTLAQTDVLKEELLISGISYEDENTTQIGYLNDLVRSSERCETLMLPGLWRKTDDARIFSLLPKTINVICYGSELPAFPTLLKRFDVNNQYEVGESIKSLESLKYGADISPILKPSNSWIVPDQDSQLFIDYFKDFVPEKIDNIPNFDLASDWLPVGEDGDLSIDDTTDEIGEDAEKIEVYKVILENDNRIYIPTGQDVMAYSEDGEIQSKISDALEPGDVILLYSYEQNREMFENVVQRTQEISGVDARIISLWRTASKSLREKYDIKNPNSVKAYLDDLKNLECQKTEQAAKMWLRGTTMAPRDLIDIEVLLRLIEFKNSEPMSKLIFREIEKTRVFHRVLGRRLRERLGGLIRGKSLGAQSTEPLEREIDEILEMAEPVAIREISQSTISVQKTDVKVNVLG